MASSSTAGASAAAPRARLYAAALGAALLVVAAATCLLRAAQTCGCEQTYMYSSYTEVPLQDAAWAQHRYRLRLYREAASPRQALPPSGHPALLIPGNAGSYEQVRSLASETARMTASARAAAAAGAAAAVPEIDWYTLDLRGELSAFDGHLLQQQTAFALACLRQLAAMYTSGSSSFNASRLPPLLRPEQRPSAGVSSKGPPPPPGLLLVGHSMGGVIARAAATAAWDDPHLGPGSISLLLSLASPHAAPPLMLQPALARFYDASRPLHLPAGLPALSLHGGGADMQVSPLLAWLPPLQAHPAVAAAGGGALRLSQSTLFTPGVWLQAGHTQIDWCNQLTRRLSAALLEACAQQQQQWQHAGGRSQEQQQQQLAAVTSEVLDQYLAGDALHALRQQHDGGAELAAQLAHAQEQQQPGQPAQPQPAAAPLTWLQQQQLRRRRRRRHARPAWHRGSSSSDVAVSASAVAAGDGEGHSLPPLLLPDVTPDDVALLHQRGLHCQAGTAATAAASAPGWLVQRQGAALVQLPSSSGSFKLRPAEGAPAAVVDHDTAAGGGGWHALPAGVQTGSLDDPAAAADGGGAESSGGNAGPQQQLGGAVHLWQVPPATTAADGSIGGSSGSLVVLASGAKPCSGFRVWVRQKQAGSEANASAAAPAATAPAAPAALPLDSNSSGSSTWLEATSLASVLPVLQDELVLGVRDMEAWLPVVQGRDYLAPAAWVLSLAEQQQQAAAITHVAVWLAPTNVTSSGGGRSEQRLSPMTLPAAASVTCQWVTPSASSKQQQPQWRRFVPASLQQPGDATAAQTAAAASKQPSSSRRWPSVTLGPLSLLQPVARPAGGPMLLRMRLQGVGLLQQLLSLRVLAHRQQPRQAGHGDAPPANASSDGATCWQPLVVYSSIWGGQEQVLVINTTLSSSSSVARPGLVWLRAMLSPWLVAHRKASSVPGYAAATSPDAPLAHVLQQQQQQAGEVDVLLLLDPSCGYSLSLGLDVLGAATQLLLSHASAAAGMAVALVLLVLSHQMSSLVRVMSVARHGTPVGPAPAAAAGLVRAGGLTLSSDSNNSSVSHEQQQQQQQLAHSSGVSTSVQLTAASPPSPAPPHNSGAALLGLQSPAAGVARRLVGSTSPRGALGADVNNVTSDGRDSDSDSSSDGSSRSSSDYGGSELLPLKHSRRHHQQPFVAGDAVPVAAAARAAADGVRQPGDGGSSLAVVPANIRQASLAAMQRMRRHMTGTLGRAPPPVQQQLVAAAAASGRAAVRLQHSSATDSGGGNGSSSGGSRRRRRPGGRLQQFTNSSGWLGHAVSSLLLPLRWMGLLQPASSSRRRKRRAGRRPAADGRPRHAHSSRSGSTFVIRSWAGAGISVVGSLVAVTGDLRVLLLAAGLSAGASALNRLNPGSIWNPHNQQQQQHVDVAPLASPLFASSGGGASTTPRSSSSASAAVAHAGSWVLQQALSLAGLQQRGDSPGLVGAAVLLCAALLLLLGAVALSVALKWVLDYVQGAMAAFHRSLTPDQATLDAIERASHGGSQPAAAAASGSSGQPDAARRRLLPAWSSSSCSCTLCVAGHAACGGLVAACCDGLAAPTAPAAWAAGGDGGGGALHHPGDIVVGGRTTPDMAPPTPEAAPPAHAASGAMTPPPPLQKQLQLQPAVPAGAAVAAGPQSMRSGKSFTDLRLLLHSFGRGSPSPTKLAHASTASSHNSTVRSLFGAKRGAGSAAAAASGSSGPWWLQRRSQVTAVVLLLLAVANLALGLAAAVLLLFFTWHLPSSSLAAGSRAAQMLLRSRAASRAVSRTASPLPAAPGDAGSAAGMAAPGSCEWQPQPGSTGATTAAAVASKSQLHTQWQQQRRHAPVRAGAGLLDTADSGQDGDSDGAGAAGVGALRAAAAAAAASGYGSEGSSGADHHDPHASLQPLARLGTISRLVQQEQARREAATSGHLQRQQQAGPFLLPLATHDGAQPASPAADDGSGGPWHAQHHHQAHAGGAGVRPSSLLPLPQPGQQQQQGQLPPLPPPRGGQHQQQAASRQQQVLVRVAPRIDAAGARALALHQLTCHMCHAWLLLYSCCCLMLLPSLLAWVQLPPGQQHLSHPLDVLLVAPILLHCVAIAAGKVDALVGYGPATAAASWRSAWVAAAGTAATSADVVAAAAAVQQQPVNLHKLVVRGAAGYMFVAALLGQAVRWLAVVAAVALLMLAGRQAVEGWQRLHAACAAGWKQQQAAGGGARNGQHAKQKGT